MRIQKKLPYNHGSNGVGYKLHSGILTRLTDRSYESAKSLNRRVDDSLRAFVVVEVQIKVAERTFVELVINKLLKVVPGSNSVPPKAMHEDQGKRRRCLRPHN